jgi:alkylation response protein AidB-like acyl-CoA dehydrogenase
MQPTYSAEAEVYREKVQAFLAEHLPTDWQGIGRLEGDELERFVRDWRQTLFEHGYLAPGWPQVYGGAGLSALEQVILAEEFTKAGVPTGGANDVFGIQMLGNTLQMWGTDEQKAHYLPRILSGEDIWCQGYSEPNAGSEPRVPRGARRRSVDHQRTEGVDVRRAPRRPHLPPDPH